ncbi:unnamed protein product [Orchesella dallaii]|uniref:Signal transducer and activator of transcription n=1 Tax=Orchesella dallaii TaxID=48710 RepID=A0ABP1RFQ3_9HEXA
MALWAKVQSLSGPAINKVHCLYGDHFPIEVRYVLANWIEDRMCSKGGVLDEASSPGGGSTTPPSTLNLDPDNPNHEQLISTFVMSLISELERKANSMVNEDPYLIRVKLLNAAQNFRQRYTLDPVSLYRYIRHCISVEQSLVDQSERFVMPNNLPITDVYGSTVIDSTGEIMEKLQYIKHKTMETADILRRMEQEQEAFALKCHDRQKLEGIIHLHRMQQQQGNVQQNSMQVQAIEKNFQEQKQRFEYELKQRITNLFQLKQDLEDKITLSVTELSALQSKVLDEELTRWKREQQLAGNGAPLTNNLDTLQSWCEDLAELIWHNRHQLKEVERLKTSIPVFNQQPQQQAQGAADRIPQLQEKVTQLLSSLVTSTFIVEKQPPQVMKTNTRFTSTVRLLVGGRLNVHMTPPQVKVAIISEAQANALLRQDKSDKPCDTSGEILNNTGTMEYHQGTRHLSVHFRNMQLKRIKRAEKKGTESVMDEKFCLHFQCQFTVGEKELIFKIWTLSLPVVVIVHGNQEPHAWATVTWDNAFGEPGRMPFQVPERVPWFRVAQALNVKFKSMTGRALTESNLQFLSEKAFRTLHTQPPPQPPDLLTWSQFCKEPLPDRNFTFWEWFYAIMKLTREHLRGPWVDGSILGFVGRNQAEEMLSSSGTSGCFLLRFSDSELGGITIAWVHNDGKVFSLAPFTSKDLQTRSLADRINDIGHLTVLYPDIPKGSAFGKYYTPLQDPMTNNNGKGYVKPQLKTHIPGLGDPSSTGAQGAGDSHGMHAFSPSPGMHGGGPTSCAAAAAALSPQGGMQSPFGNMGYYNNNPTSPSAASDESSLHGNTTPTHPHDFGSMNPVATTTSGGGTGGASR